MSDFSSRPGTVLVVVDVEESADGIADVLTAGSAAAVETVAMADDPSSRLGPGTDVGCVLVLAGDGTELEAVCRACREADPDVPIVLGPDHVDTTDLESVTALGDVRVVGEAASAAIAERVEDALDAYERRNRLREDATILRSLLGDIGVPLYAKDRDGRHVRMANAPGARNPRDVFGKRDTEIYPDSDAAEESLEDDLRVVEEETTIYGREEEFETDSGPQWLRTNKAPWRDEQGRVRGVVGITWDVTDEMINQQRLAEREETFETFAKSLSHDVRTPLQVARGNIELLREAVDDEEPAERADDALERITEMMEDLEVLAKEETGESTDPELGTEADALTEPLAITAVAEHVWSIVDTGNATLAIEFDDDAVALVDEANLRPLLENLFTNAIRHAGPEVSVKLGHIETGGFFVEDDGSGIPEDQRQKVLQEGYTTVEDGSGTGFSIVRGVVNRCEWDLAITDAPDGGARVEIHNCLLVADPPAPVDPGERVGLGESDDVGDVGVAGSAEYDGQHNQWILEGAGRNIWHQINELHFLHSAVDGPVRVEGRIADFDAKSQYSKAGFMIRSGLEEEATYGYVGETANDLIEVLWRNRRGEDGVSQRLGDSQGGHWYRIDRRGDTVTAYVSPDGEDWMALDQRLVETAESVEVGLAVCSHMPQTTCRGIFADVTVRTLPED